MTHKLIKTFQYGFVVLAVLAVAYLMSVQSIAEASVSVTDEYMATSTATNAVYGATVTGSSVIRTGTGSLGSFVITGANTGIINFYDATTTDINKRTGNKATSTILIANFPASVAAGVYTFDAVYSTALYIDLIAGNMATGTVTYR